ncbi:MAG: hypothetical protein A3A97_04330 [Candidatus Terrybacteria bacterium RIFCSPLOWO2_01_FULL_40_23]|uniref:Uncharacterized protein n=1 Tax=Candidatus Terrybacteria bacterium RIFCSPLOWO2_01_FULL_40_23 TaxID=1802366 RepID=A0A1G2PVK3_9BACT|nr:MAG: hypothetical protein A3A97_04330 [Candidatus Terrybacteria bacterium RIFCSPLOWO2_01_FULL_40_23]
MLYHWQYLYSQLLKFLSKLLPRCRQLPAPLLPIALTYVVQAETARLFLNNAFLEYVNTAIQAVAQILITVWVIQFTTITIIADRLMEHAVLQ